MNWLQHRIVDLFNALAAWYYRRKFGAAARQLGRPPDEGNGQRGFIIVEIDGLAYEYLRQAIRRGYMPYLARLLREKTLRLGRWRCGLPSTTPASQAGILYGNNWDIPGFRWYDKETQSSIMCKLPGSVREIQERIAEGRVGLLRGGSSYTNMFDGDARLALFTLSAMGRHRLLENVRGLGFLILFVLSPIRVLKIAGLSLATWLVYVAKRVLTWLRVRPQGVHFTFLGPLFEIFNNVVFREVTTFSVLLDIYRGMPSIYAAYTGYDEIAHHFGADSSEALRALRGIDKQIRQIDRARRLDIGREYDLYILSDHGMTPSTPFHRAYGQTLEDLVARHTGQDVAPGDPQEANEGLPATRTQFLLEEIRGLESRPQAAVPARALRVARRRLETLLQDESPEAGWNLSRRGELAIRSSGSLAHLYLNVTQRPMDLSEIALLYPSLLDALVAHEGIGLAAGREGEGVVLLAKEGTLWIGPGEVRLEGAHPLGWLSHPDWATEQVARVVRFPHAGDLILLGAWDGDRVISFEDQVSTHGGLGGAQDWPFLAYPAGQRLMPQSIENSEEVYARLKALYFRDA